LTVTISATRTLFVPLPELVDWSSGAALAPNGF